MGYIYLLALALLALSALCQSSNITNTLWPKPKNFSSLSTATLTISPCQLSYLINAGDKLSIESTISLYQNKVFNCSTIVQRATLAIKVTHKGQFIATKLQHETYTLTLSNNTNWTLTADYYVGFLRGIETLFQLFTPQTNGNYLITGIPLSIEDSPDFLWRGLMVDTSRHFLDVATLKRIIDAMLFSKLNVLHWHIVD